MTSPSQVEDELKPWTCHHPTKGAFDVTQAHIDAARLLLKEGWYQISRHHRILARLPKGKTGKEALLEAMRAEGKTVPAWIESLSEGEAGDQYLRTYASIGDRHEVDEATFAAYRKLGGQRYKHFDFITSLDLGLPFRPPSSKVFFAGMTGPNASGGVMVCAYVVEEADRTASWALVVRDDPSASWHSATYRALTYALSQQGAAVWSSCDFITDNMMVAKQLSMERVSKGGRYTEDRREALEVLRGFCHERKPTLSFNWVPHDKNPAVKLAAIRMAEIGVRPWTYKRESDETE